MSSGALGTPNPNSPPPNYAPHQFWSLVRQVKGVLLSFCPHCYKHFHISQKNLASAADLVPSLGAKTRRHELNRVRHIAAVIVSEAIPSNER